MRFALTDDQAALREAARELLSRECPPAAVRAGWPGEAADPDRVAAVWGKLAEMGVLGAAVPEESGGLGLGACDVVPLLEEAGRVALPLPIVETAFVAAPLLAAAGEAELLERLVAGELLVACALDGSGVVPWAGTADVLLVADRAGGQVRLIELSGRGESGEGGSGRGGAANQDAAGSAAPDVLIEFVDSIDGARAVGRLADPGAGRPLDLPAAVAEAAWDRGALGAAAQLVGLSRALLAMSTDYVKERRQFGVAIGTFQAVKHQLASALLGLEFAAPAVLRAAWSLDQGAETAGRDVAMAKALAGEAAERVAATALQVHGAIAYTTEYDLHLFAKRVWASARTWGDAEWQRARVAAALGLDPASAVP